MTLHYPDPARSGAGWSPRPLCGHEWLMPEGDEVLAPGEAEDPAGRHFDCLDCHKILSGGVKHVRPPEGEGGDDGR